jgi:hypothetical protein
MEHTFFLLDGKEREREGKEHISMRNNKQKWKSYRKRDRQERKKMDRCRG